MYASDIYFVFNYQLFTYFSLDLPTVWRVPRLSGVSLVWMVGLGINPSDTTPVSLPCTRIYLLLFYLTRSHSTEGLPSSVFIILLTSLICARPIRMGIKLPLRFTHSNRGHVTHIENDRLVFYEFVGSSVLWVSAQDEERARLSPPVER